MIYMHKNINVLFLSRLSLQQFLLHMILQHLNGNAEARLTTSDLGLTSPLGSDLT